MIPIDLDWAAIKAFQLVGDSNFHRADCDCYWCALLRMRFAEALRGAARDAYTSGYEAGSKASRWDLVP